MPQLNLKNKLNNLILIFNNSKARPFTPLSNFIENIQSDSKESSMTILGTSNTVNLFSSPPPTLVRRKLTVGD